jgi:hypothetical protein
MEAFTPRNVAKFVAKSIVSIKTAQLAEQTITDHTHFEEDDTVVTLASSVVGWYVADKLKPVTDLMIDKAADKIVEVRANRAAKKTPAE